MKNKNIDKQENTILKFIERTKKGKYSEIEESSYEYSRCEILREEPYQEFEYQYFYR